MSPALFVIEAALFISQALPACALLSFWLWRHRRMKLSYRRSGHVASDATSRVRPHPRAKPEWVREKILYLASHLRSCRDVTHTFNRWQGGWATVGKTWVAEFIREHADEIHQLRRMRKRCKPQFIPVGHTWALDLTFIQSPHGTTFTVLGIIDAGSRKLLCLKVLPTKCAFALLGHLFLAFSRHGLPAAIRTDNEAMFTCAIWRMTLKALAIAHRRGPPLQPWRNGRVERLFGTLKATLADLAFAAPLALQAALDQFARFYNKARPHQSLDGLTPEEVWQGKTMADVQQIHAQRQWIEVLEGSPRVYHVRC